MTDDPKKAVLSDLSGALDELRSELDEHLDAVNQNTVEVESLHEIVGELDLKLEKLAERVDALQLLLLAQTRQDTTRASLGRPLRLTGKEETLFSALLDAREPLTSEQLGKQVGLTADLAAQTLYCLKQKGVPIMAHTADERTFYALEDAFKAISRSNGISSN